MRMGDRVDFDDHGELDEIVSASGAHLERMDKNRWFLEFMHEDGTSTAIWFSSKDLRQQLIETPRARSAGIEMEKVE